MIIFSVSSRDRIDLSSILLGLFPEPWGAVRVGDGRPGWLAPCPCSLMESPLSCRIPSPGEGGHRSFMGVEARAGQADLQTWLWWEADTMDRGGLRLGCCQPHQEPCREDRKVPAADLEKTVWFLACGRKWHLALHVCTLTNPSAITLNLGAG